MWLAVQTVATHENAVGERIKELGYDVLAPKARMRVNGVMAVRALFPGYLFAETDGQWYGIRWCIGVIRVVMAGEQPARVPDHEIDKILRETGRNGLVRLPKKPRVPPRTAIAVGDEVKIITGQFRGLHALYQGSTPKECQMVLLELLGRACPVELAPDDRCEVVPEAERKVLPLIRPH